MPQATTQEDEQVVGLLLDLVSGAFEVSWSDVTSLSLPSMPDLSGSWDAMSNTDRIAAIRAHAGPYVVVGDTPGVPYKAVPRPPLRAQPPSAATAPVPPHAPTPPAGDASSLASQNEIMSYLATNSACAHTPLLFSLLAPAITALTPREFNLCLHDMLTKSSTLKLDEPFGRVGTATASTFNTWRLSFQRDIISVGPLLLAKYLYQVGVAWETFDILPNEADPADRMPVLIFKRGGYSMYITHKYEVSIANDSQEFEGEEAMRAFADALDGLPFPRTTGKFLGYQPIPQEAYDLAGTFCTSFSVTSAKGKISQCEVNATGPILDPALAHFFADQVRPGIRTGSPVGGDPDNVFEFIAYTIWKLAGDRLSALNATVTRTALTLANRELAAVIRVIRAGALTGEAKKQRVITNLKLSDSPDRALSDLAAARKLRNVTQITQQVQKGVGSAYASDSPVRIETLRKGVSLVSHVLKHAPALADAENEWHSYGVAYNHFGPAFDKVKGPVRMFDVQKAKGSLAKYEDRSVLDATGCAVIIDDSYRDSRISAEDAAKYKVPDSFHFDQVKLVVFMRLLMESKVQVVLTKIGLRNFTKDEHAKTMSILFPDGKEKLPHVRMYKFGKLHNGECYISLSTNGGFPPNNPVDPARILWGDIKSISMVVAYVNRVIMMANATGSRLCSVRASGPDPARGRGLAPGVPLQPEYTPHRLWRSFLAVLPVNWWWYTQAQTEPITTKAVTAGEAIDFEAEYDDPTSDSDTMGSDYDVGPLSVSSSGAAPPVSAALSPALVVRSPVLPQAAPSSSPPVRVTPKSVPKGTGKK